MQLPCGIIRVYLLFDPTCGTMLESIINYKNNDHKLYLFTKSSKNVNRNFTNKIW